MTDLLYADLDVGVRRRDDVGTYEFGVFLDGAWVVLAQVKQGGVDDNIALAKDEAAQAAAAAPPPPLVTTTQ